MGGFRVSSSSLGRVEICRFWERMKKRANLVVNKLECKLLGGGYSHVATWPSPPHDATWTPKSQ